MAGNPCCCASCTIVSDDFNRADSSSPGGNWSVVSGTPTVAASSAYFAAMEVDLSHDTTGGECWLLFGVQDSTHYFYLKFTFNDASGTITAFRNNGGTITALKTSDGNTDATRTITLTPGV